MARRSRLARQNSSCRLPSTKRLEESGIACPVAWRDSDTNPTTRSGSPREQALPLPSQAAHAVHVRPRLDSLNPAIWTRGLPAKRDYAAEGLKSRRAAENLRLRCS